MKTMLLLSVLILSSIGLVAQTTQKWVKVNAGSTESGIPGDPTLRFGVGTGFGANGDDVLVVSNEVIKKLNNNGTGTESTLATLPTGLASGSKTNGILKHSNGLIYTWGFFPINSTQYYGLMVSDAANPTSFSVVPSSLSTYQFGTHVAQRGIVTFTEYSYGFPVAQPGFVLYGPDLLTLNGVSVPSTVAFMDAAGAVTDLPQFKPNTEQRVLPTYPVTNPRILYMAKRSNLFATNGNLLVGGRYNSLGGVPYNGLISYDNSTSTFTNFNVTNSSGNQAVTQYNASSSKEYVTWKNDNQATNGGVNSPGLLEINSSNVIVGVSGGAPNLQSNCLTTFDSKLYIGGSRYNSTLPANTYTYNGTTFADASGDNPNNLDNNGTETLYDLFSTPNFVYATGNFQIVTGDVANYIAVRKLSSPLALLFKSLRGELQNNSTKINFEMHIDGDVEIQQSGDGINFVPVETVGVLKNVVTTKVLPSLNSSITYVRLKSQNEYSATLVLRKSDKGIINVFRSGSGVVINTPNNATYTLFDPSGRVLQKGTVNRGVSIVPVDGSIRGMVFFNIQASTEQYTRRMFF